VIDAAGLLAVPGMIDQHIHFMDPAEPDRETFPAGSAAAAVAGVTCVVEHTHAAPVLDADALAAKAEYLADRSHVDYLLAAHATADAPELAAELRAAGVAFMKCFTCTTHGIHGFDPDDLLRLFRAAAAADIRVLVHCEDEAITAGDERRLRAAGRSDDALLREWRSSEAELVAVATVALLARETGAHVTIAHATQPATVDLAMRERALGARLDVETCPQYLLLDGREVDELGPLRKFTPPARPAPAAEGLWEAVRDGRITYLSSDHAPSTLAQKAAGDIWSAPFGLPGVQTSFPLLLDAALAGRVSLERVVEAYALAPATALRIADRKGALEPGLDADVVLVDPDARWTLRNEDILSGAGWTPYAGRQLMGRPVMTLVRGQVVARDGAVTGDPGHGRFVAAGR
jgi:dihydroorotase